MVVGKIKRFKNLFGLRLETNLGRNSAVINIKMVDRMVWVIITITCGGCSIQYLKILSIEGSSSSAAISPKTTSPMQLPTSMVPINLLGLLVTIANNFPVKLLLFLSSSTLNLLLDTNAISVPAKNAQRINDKKSKRSRTSWLMMLQSN